tara:strand:+ start:462 stop:1232 length:771 start_codon:yes stop_codon:yes gene_type:complete
MSAKLIILGCGNSIGVPTIDGMWGNCNMNNIKNLRTRCSAIILKGSNSILIDTSPDIRNQLINNDIKNLSSVIYTHEHADQTNGLFELRPFYWKNKKKINIYGDKYTVKDLKKRFGYCFKSSKMYPAIVKANFIKKRFSVGHSKEKIVFNTLQAKHGFSKSIIYIFEKTAYVSDCNDYSIVKSKELTNLNYLILDCLKYKKNLAHFNFDDCLYIHNCLKPKKTILTNLHHDLDYISLKKKLPRDIIPAYDGLKISL